MIILAKGEDTPGFCTQLEPFFLLQRLGGTQHLICITTMPPSQTYLEAEKNIK
jgi:hypothetical protein